MDFDDVIRRRYSVRAYRPDPVPDDLLRRVLEAAVLAPTACNRQPFRLLVVQTAGRQADLARVYRWPWFSQAPIVIGIVALPAEAWTRRDGRNYADVDATIAMDHLVLAAASLGLGTCWVAAFDPAAVRDVFALPAGVEPIAFTPLGYPADVPGTKTRRSLEELVRYERWEP